MKYIAIAVGYLIIWSIITPILIIERTIKCLIIAIQIIWHLKVEREWFEILNEYHLIIPGLGNAKIDNIKDYYLLRNWEEL